MKIIPWKHSPGIIARVEHYDQRGNIIAYGWTATLRERMESFSTYELAQSWLARKVAS